MRKIETKMKQLSHNPFFGLMKCKPLLPERKRKNCPFTQRLYINQSAN